MKNIILILVFALISYSVYGYPLNKLEVEGINLTDYTSVTGYIEYINIKKSNVVVGIIKNIQQEEIVVGNKLPIYNDKIKFRVVGKSNVYEITLKR